MHPLIGDLSSLSDVELQKKQSELIKRLNQSYRSGSSHLFQQLSLLLQSYNEEIQRRQQKVIDDARRSGKNFDDIIDIGQ